MQSDAASSATPAIPEQERDERGLRHGIIASVLLHVGLVLVVERTVTTPLPSANETARPSLQVSIVTRSPRITEPPSDAATDTPGDKLAEASVAGSAELPPPAAAEAPVLEASLADTPASALPTIDDEPSETTLDISRLQESIRGTLGLHRSNTLDQQMDACRQYRERYARWNCPQDDTVKTEMQEAIDTRMQATFRAWTYGHSENERISRQLLADMDTLRPLMNDAGVLGEVARTRYYLKAEQYTMMNPPGSQDGTVTILTLTPSGLVILNGWMTIGFDGEVKGQGPARDFGYAE